MTRFLLTTNPGIEDIAKNEVKNKISPTRIYNFFNFPGKFVIETSDSNINKILKLHSIYHVIKLLGSFEISKLDDIYNNLIAIDIEDIQNAESFRITSERFGEHDFTSMHVQKVAGQAVVDKYRKKVDLKGFDVNLRVDVIGKRCFVGVQLTKESLHKRFEKPFNHPASIKAPLAYAMLILSDIKKGNTLLDPFCGSGTIPIEAALVFGNTIKIHGSDKEEFFIKGARKNAEAAGVGNLIKFRVADARSINEVYKDIDRIVTNPPYGVRIGKDKTIKHTIHKFLLAASQSLNDDGRIVMINLRANSIRNIIYKTRKFTVVHERVVESGGLYPHIFVLEKI